MSKHYVIIEVESETLQQILIEQLTTILVPGLDHKEGDLEDHAYAINFITQYPDLAKVLVSDI